MSLHMTGSCPCIHSRARASVNIIFRYGLQQLLWRPAERISKILLSYSTSRKSEKHKPTSLRWQTMKGGNPEKKKFLFPAPLFPLLLFLQMLTKTQCICLKTRHNVSVLGKLAVPCMEEHLKINCGVTNKEYWSIQKRKNEQLNRHWWMH